MVDAGRPDHHAIPHHHPPIPRRQIVAQVIVGVVILASGVVIGSGGAILALKDRIVPVFKSATTDGNAMGRDPNEMARRTDWIVGRWKDEYGLSDEQMRQARDTLTKQFAATERLWEDFDKAEQNQREKFALAMKGILTSDQFARWDADFRRMVENMRRFDPRRGGRGGPPGEKRPEWRPGPRMEPNDHRGDRPPRDANGPRGDWQRNRFKSPDSRRGDKPRDPNGHRGDEPPEQFMGPAGPPAPDRPMEPNDRSTMPPESE